MMGAQTSLVQQEKILSYIKLEGAELLTGGEQNHLEGDLLLY
jgi:aldehyde dehydrogenase